MSATFDKFMVSNSIGTNRKLRRLPVAQRWVYVAGVLALASQSPIRGALLITDGEHVTAEDVAAEATVKVSEARAALTSLRYYGMLLLDEHGVDWLPDWEECPNPAYLVRAERMRSAPGFATTAQVAGRVDLYGGLCWICRERPYEAIDHVKPISKGGSNWPANLRPACTPCNSSKGAKWPYRRAS